MKMSFSGIKKSYRTRAFKAGSYSVFAGLFVLAIAIVINLLVSALPNSITQKDVTDSGLYSVSEQTKQLVSGLNQDITVYWITQPTAGETAVEKLLDNYKDLNNRITVKKIDPVEYPNFTKQYTDEQIYNNTLIVVCGDKYKVLGYYDIYQYDYQTYYTGQSENNYKVSFAGENALTSALDYVTSTDLPVIYALSGHGETDLPETLIKQIKNENFVLNKDLSLLSLEAMPEDCDLLIINAPQSDLSADDRDKLLKYLQNGGKLMLVTGLFKDAAKLDNLAAVTSYYGVTKEDGIVIEGDADHIISNYYYYLLPDIDPSHEITKPISEAKYKVLVPVAAGLTVSDNLREGLEVTKLLTTSDSSFVKPGGLGITTYDKQAGDKDGPFALAVAIAEKDTKIVWLGSALTFDDNADSFVSGANYDFFMNSLGWMTGEKDSISIRAKSLDEPTLTVTSGEAARMSLIIIGVLPLGVLFVGIYVFARRKRR